LGGGICEVGGFPAEVLTALVVVVVVGVLVMPVAVGPDERGLEGLGGGKCLAAWTSMVPRTRTNKTSEKETASFGTTTIFYEQRTGFVESVVVVEYRGMMERINLMIRLSPTVTGSEQFFLVLISSSYIKDVKWKVHKVTRR